MTNLPGLGQLWNIGCKTTDVAGEATFLQRLGARAVLHEALSGPAGPVEYALLELGGTRIVLTPTPAFESSLDYDLRPGLTHAVFEVNDPDAIVAEATAAGGRRITEARTIEGGFGRRRIVFLQSPGGLVFEAFRTLEQAGDD